MLVGTPMWEWVINHKNSSHWTKGGDTQHMFLLPYSCLGI